jgi:sialic acid synthase
MDTVRSIYNLLTAAKSQFCLLHCVSAYPTPAQDINLRVIETYKREFPDIPIGYSGHELGTAISLAAVAMGAQVDGILLGGCQCDTSLTSWWSYFKVHS